MPTTSAATAPAHDERLWPSPAGWALVPALGVMGAIVLLPLGVLPGVVAGGVALLAAATGAVRLATRVRVTGGELVAGAAHIPVALLRSPRALDADATRQALGPGLDARTHVALRGWVRTGVLVDVDDPADPTPSWFVSTRHPDALVAALEAAGATPAPADGADAGPGTPAAG